MLLSDDGVDCSIAFDCVDNAVGLTGKVANQYRYAECLDGAPALFLQIPKLLEDDSNEHEGGTE